MTRKDYILIAAALKRARDAAVSEGHKIGNADAAILIAAALATDNPRFDRSRFLKACGVDVPRETWGSSVLQAGAL